MPINCFCPNSFSEIRCPRLYCHSLRWELLNASVGHEVLQLQCPPADEAEGRTQRCRTVHVSHPQNAQRVGVIVGDMSLIAVEAHTQPGGHRSGVAVREAAVAAAVGVRPPLAVAVAVALALAGTVSLRKQDLAHAYCEETEGGRVLAFLRSAVMAAVRVTAGG